MVDYDVNFPSGFPRPLHKRAAENGRKYKIVDNKIFNTPL
jgi:hypothetical protein